MPTIYRQYSIHAVIAACRDYVTSPSPWPSVMPRQPGSGTPKKKVLVEYVVRVGGLVAVAAVAAVVVRFAFYACSYQPTLSRHHLSSKVRRVIDIFF